jgi:hypothetical protein
MPLVSYLLRNAADAEETYGERMTHWQVYRIQAAGYPSMSLAGS